MDGDGAGVLPRATAGQAVNLTLIFTAMMVMWLLVLLFYWLLARQS